MPRYIPDLPVRDLIKAGYLYDLIKLGRVKVSFRGSNLSPPEWRFWARVDKLGPIPAHMPHLGRCWPWKGARSAGYGTLRVGGKSEYTHVYSYCLAHPGEPPLRPGEVIRHDCDNKLCVNPSHLFRGTDQDNVDDCVAKGRQAKGESQGYAKLTDDLVRWLRKVHRPRHPKYSATALARELGLSPSGVHAAIVGISWRHIR
jgi:hypothetical protein